MKKFINDFAQLFDDVDNGVFTPETCFHELEEYSSLTALGIIAMIDGEETDVTGNILPPDAVFLCGDFSSPWDRPMQPIPIGDTVELPNSRACMGLLPHSHFNSCFLKKSRMDMAPIASAIADTIGVAHKICSGPKSMRMTKNRAISRVPLLSRDSTKAAHPVPWPEKRR